MIDSEFIHKKIDKKQVKFEFEMADGEKFDLWLMINPDATQIDLHLHGFGSGMNRAKGMHLDERSARIGQACVALYDNVKAWRYWDSGLNRETEISLAIGYERYKEIHLAAIRKLLGMSKRETKINLLGHSMGSAATLDTLLELRPEERERIGKVVLHSMPVEQSRDRFAQVFQRPDRPRTNIDYDGLSILQRSDGSRTCMPAHIWDEMERMDGVSLASKALEIGVDLHLIYAEDDKVLFPDGVNEEEERRMRDRLNTLKTMLGENFHTVPEGGHDFEGEGRIRLLTELAEIMNGK